MLGRRADALCAPAHSRSSHAGTSVTRFPRLFVCTNMNPLSLCLTVVAAIIVTVVVVKRNRRAG